MSSVPRARHAANANDRVCSRIDAVIARRARRERCVGKGRIRDRSHRTPLKSATTATRGRPESFRSTRLHRCAPITRRRAARTRSARVPIAP
ncbi:hypothetical protein LC55x_1719 [Lysobacter capsici]|nr:hypothetical protein LC55x_1719 [Lysobacter capsici]